MIFKVLFPVFPSNSITWNDQHTFVITCLSYLEEIEFSLNSSDDLYFTCGQIAQTKPN